VPLQGYYVKDGFLGADAAAAMRAEAVALHSAGEMSPGQSTRWNAATCAVETYDKAQVLTTQVLGGANYLKSPRLVEYIVAITKVNWHYYYYYDYDYDYDYGCY
jgi:uridylate kinase